MLCGEKRLSTNQTMLRPFAWQLIQESRNDSVEKTENGALDVVSPFGLIDVLIFGRFENAPFLRACSRESIKALVKGLVKAEHNQSQRAAATVTVADSRDLPPTHLSTAPQIEDNQDWTQLPPVRDLHECCRQTIIGPSLTLLTVTPCVTEASPSVPTCFSVES